MKRKRYQTEETCQSFNDGKKFRLNETDLNSEQHYDSILDVSTISQKEEFVLTREIVEHEIISDISGNKWRIGKATGKGSFGEIFLVSDDITKPVNVKNSNYVIKIEPHSNGPLFVEIHCLMNVNKQSSDEIDADQTLTQSLPENVGIPRYIASGSHYFTDIRYRFLIMPRYKADLHSIIRKGRLSQKHFLIIASQIIDVLMRLHEKHYVHSDIKAENIMVGRCKPDNEKSKQTFLKSEKSTKDHRTANLYSNSRSHNLRPTRTIAYTNDENSKSSHGQESEKSYDDSEQDQDFELSPRKRKAQKAEKKAKNKRNRSKSPKKVAKNLFCKPFNLIPKHDKDLIVDESSSSQVYVIDYGLATKFINTVGGETIHKPFCCDERRAHDGTLEFTSRDAHFGVHSRRSDLECLGFNLIYWSQGFLPWKDDKLKEQPEIVHRLKEVFMTDVKEMLKLLYGKDCPHYLGEYMNYVGRLEFDQEPDYKFLKGLFEKEFSKLGYKKSDMKLDLQEMQNDCVFQDKSLSENELMLTKITDVKTARKLGFLIVTDSVDGNETQIKSNEISCMNVSCKASPKNLRSKEKTKEKRPKRHPKATEKELIIEKMTQGVKLTLKEIAVLDPGQLARARADREYERSDEKSQHLTPQKYYGNPTYAILEIENKLKLRQSGSIIASTAPSVDIEPIKGYTKQMMDVLKKQQLLLEQQLSPCHQKRNRELKNVIKATPAKRPLKNVKPKGIQNAKKSSLKRKSQKIEEIPIEDVAFDEEETPKPTRPRRGRPSKQQTKVQKVQPEAAVQLEAVEAPVDVEEIEKPVKRKRGRPKIIRTIIEPPDTEEDSVYYDIPGEGSNDGVKDISEDENAPEIISQKRSRNTTPSSDGNSNQESVPLINYKNKNKKHKGRYYAEVNYDASTDETTNMSSVSNASGTSWNARKRQVVNEAIGTRNKVKSRSTSRSAEAAVEATDQSECSEISESEYEMQSGEDSGDDVQEMEYDQSGTEEDEEENMSDVADDFSNDSNDSIDFKYSPITKTRHSRNVRNVKSVRGRRINVINETDRNFRLVSTQG